MALSAAASSAFLPAATAPTRLVRLVRLVLEAKNTPVTIATKISTTIVDIFKDFDRPEATFRQKTPSSMLLSDRQATRLARPRTGRGVGRCRTGEGFWGPFLARDCSRKLELQRREDVKGRRGARKAIVLGQSAPAQFRVSSKRLLLLSGRRRHGAVVFALRRCRC